MGVFVYFKTLEPVRVHPDYKIIPNIYEIMRELNLVLIRILNKFITPMNIGYPKINILIPSYLLFQILVFRHVPVAGIV